MWFAGNRKRLETVLQVAVRCICGVVTALCPLVLVHNHQNKDIVGICHPQRRAAAPQLTPPLPQSVARGAGLGHGTRLHLRCCFWGNLCNVSTPG